jgi:hypothetical protein
MYDDLERMWKEVVVAELEVLSLYLPGGTEASFRFICVVAEFRTKDLPNTFQNYYRLSQPN